MRNEFAHSGLFSTPYRLLKLELDGQSGVRMAIAWLPKTFREPQIAGFGSRRMLPLGMRYDPASTHLSKYPNMSNVQVHAGVTVEYKITGSLQPNS
jgi:hypothetical protein